MYLEHFGLSRQPFRLTPDTALFFSGSERGAALEALKFSIEEGIGIIKVIGEVGTGKTMLCHMLADQLGNHIDIIYIVNPSLPPIQMLVALAIELDIPAQESWSKIKLMQALMHTLLLKHTQNRQVVLLVEEAQSMPIETLEEIRLLSNLETGHAKLLQIVLFGQPELDDYLNQHEIRQLKERIHYQFYLKPFDQQAIHRYLEHRLKTSGYQGTEMFNQRAAKAIQKYSKGLARRINLLADKAMMIAYSNNRHTISYQDILQAVKDQHVNLHHTHRLSWLLVGLLYTSLSILLYNTLSL